MIKKQNLPVLADLLSRAVFTYMTALMLYTAGNLLCFYHGRADLIGSCLTPRLLPDVIEHVLMSILLVCGSAAAGLYLSKRK